MVESSSASSAANGMRVASDSSAYSRAVLPTG